ncbi:MAG TPA: helix-turn-helix domain-containing protein [Candidatus Stackebrandtia faecavium]|nr:helix-turn-helix domain-containing protein [Candidatus Stackebrandtia faecavium]
MTENTKAPLEIIAHSLRRERQRVDLSLSEVAKRAGISKSTLSQLESGSGNPSVETLWALSVALDVPFAQLVEQPAPRIQLIRAGEGPTVAAAGADYHATMLAACPPHARRDIYAITASPGSVRRSQPHMAGVVEHVIMASGSARVGLEDDPVTLSPGDYLAYPGDLPHVFEALEDNTFATMISEHT